MNTTTGRWAVFDDAVPLLTYDYSFGPGFARALAIGGPQGLVVASPPCGVPASAYDDLARHGDVKVLLATNAFHTLGIAPWKARFPAASIFAPAQSITRVERVAKVAGVRPVRELAPFAGPDVEFTDMPYYRTGEVLVRVATGRGLVWYVTDVFMNMPELPRHPVARTLFAITGSAPGPRYNGVAPLFMMKDRRAVRRWLGAEAARQKPRWLIPAHGDIVDLDANDEARRRLQDV